MLDLNPVCLSRVYWIQFFLGISDVGQIRPDEQPWPTGGETAFPIIRTIKI